LRLLDHHELQNWLGKKARKALIDGGWEWKVKAEEYRRFFRRALTSVRKMPTEKITIEPSDFRHYANVLHEQFVLERDLRIGYASQCIDLEKELEAARREIREIKDSETYVLAEHIKSTKVIRGLVKLYQQFKK